MTEEMEGVLGDWVTLSKPIVDHAKNVFNSRLGIADLAGEDAKIDQQSLENMSVYLGLISQMLITAVVDRVMAGEDPNPPSQRLLEFIKEFADEEGDNDNEQAKADSLIDTLFTHEGQA
jgi:hypothetical protein